MGVLGYAVRFMQGGDLAGQNLAGTCDLDDACDWAGCVVARAAVGKPIGAVGRWNIVIGDGLAVAIVSVGAIVQVGGPFVVFRSVRVDAVYEDSAAGGDGNHSLVLAAEVGGGGLNNEGELGVGGGESCNGFVNKS